MERSEVTPAASRSSFEKVGVDLSLRVNEQGLEERFVADTENER